MNFLRFGVLSACLCLLSGCGIIDYYFLPAPEDTVQEIYENAQDAMRDQRYKDAIESYTKIKDNYPFSPYAIEAELAVGDAYYLLEKYPEAAESYREFETLHPRHQSAPYVLYQIGMSELNSFTSLDRPTTMVQQALEYFNRLQETYPDTDYAAKAKEQIIACRKILAEHELFIGDMFWRMEKYGSARERYLYVVNNYPDVPQVPEHAAKKAEAAYFKDREQKAEQDRRKKHGHWRDWFDWL